ncbi:DUF6086 family protein [Streptomyces sp. NEAU-H22]|uniref:DUF6086 family protein n=1 Tax=unclassified Streptomyces TaxID=2593676 RepID=UPI0022532859|nr:MULTISPECIES: DUF6086 family protein [unclassified Streptomyces]MCX3287239.1 DUF6086 family protein [Streptomyces sp. NEAU-H22]WMD02972.1 DUF6086 family protein [Streptomyces sp. FXY-T5]
MSQYFDIGDETLWNPSNGVARMFQRQVAVFEAELALPSGIGPMENDECQIDPETFETFVNALLATHRRTSHAIWLALSEGFIATVLVLAERAAIKVAWERHGAAPEAPLEDVQVSTVTGMSAPAEGAAWAAGLREKSRELGRRMPR